MVPTIAHLALKMYDYKTRRAFIVAGYARGSDNRLLSAPERNQGHAASACAPHRSLRLLLSLPTLPFNRQRQ
jgi:hypothetical protein